MKKAGQGVIFNIQRFCTHDGPGIRTVIFMKGCPLRCLWCANPESQDPQPQLMVRRDLCLGCRRCEAACPHGAVSQAEDGRTRIDWNSCTRCFKCIDACSGGALEKMGRCISVNEIMAVVEEDRLFHKNSGGGVTISGGEPLFQAGFLRSLLEALKVRGQHTALETSGFAPWDRFKEILPFVDLLLFDIKCLDAERHMHFTGKTNAAVLENLIAAAEMVPTWIRIPLISGINDSAADIHGIARMARDRRVAGISLLPHHDGGSRKRSQLGLMTEGDTFQAPPEDVMLGMQDIISKYGLKCTIGR